MKINSTNNVVIKPVGSVKPENPTKQIPNFTDYIYKLEQNIKNKLITDENIKNKNISYRNHSDLCDDVLEHLTCKNMDNNSKCTNKLCEPLILSCNLKKSVFKFRNQLHLNKSEIKKEFIPLKDCVPVIESCKKLDLHQAEEKLNKIRNSIIDFSSSTAILYASYLLSASIVSSLLNTKTIECLDSFDDD